MQWLRWLVDELSLWRPVFNHGQIRVRYIVEKVTLRLVCFEFLL
jgi:hypothetical protein